MNASESELPPLTESDHDETVMTFDDGGVPVYVAVIWVVFLACYVAYMVMYGLPDFSEWLNR